jgi:hypothetical protein
MPREANQNASLKIRNCYNLKEARNETMARIATTYDGQLCSRCNGFVSPSSAGTMACACTDGLLTQFASESEGEQELVRNMLFMEHMAADTNVPMPKRIDHTNQLKALHSENEQLAIRNAVRSPFRTGS